jgi:hypothetical protein
VDPIPFFNTTKMYLVLNRTGHFADLFSMSLPETVLVYMNILFIVIIRQKTELFITIVVRTPYSAHLKTNFKINISFVDCVLFRFIKECFPPVHQFIEFKAA